MIDRQIVLSALRALESLKVQLENGLSGQVVAGYCLREKLDLLTLHVKMIERNGVCEVEPARAGDAR